MHRVLVVGYGNVMRSDDAAGVHAAHVLEETYRDQPEVRVIGAHQLTPELSEEIAEARYVLFLDASAEGDPGSISQRPVAAEGVLGAVGHHITPGVLLCYAEQLYGEVPAALSLTLTGASFAIGTGLSPVVSARMEQFIQRAAAIIQSWLGPGSAEHSDAHLIHLQ